jgi:hypothetical protein
MSVVQFAFSKNLLDFKQTPSFKIIEEPIGSGNFKIHLTLGLNVSSGSVATHREAKVEEEIYSSAITAAIGLEKVTGSVPDEPSSIISVVFKSILKTKVPGTGSSFRPFDLEKSPIE